MAWPGFGWMIGKHAADHAIDNVKKQIADHEQKKSFAVVPPGSNNNAGQRTEVHIGGPGVATYILLVGGTIFLMGLAAAFFYFYFIKKKNKPNKTKRRKTAKNLKRKDGDDEDEEDEFYELDEATPQHGQDDDEESRP